MYHMECGVFIGFLFIACAAGYGAFVGRKRLVKAVDVSYHVFGIYGASAGSRDSQYKLSFKDIRGPAFYFSGEYLGIPAIREGSLIKTRHASLMVEDPCSGIRSLIALIALGALMAYFSNLSRPKRVIIFAASIPIAVATNVVRIASLTLIGEIYGEQYATGMVHDTMGIFVFVLAFLGLSAVANLLE